MTNKLLSIGHFALTLVILFVILFSGKDAPVGGTTNYDAVDVTDGYSVDGTTIIDGSGNFTVTGTFTATGEIQARNLVYGDANAALPGITISTTSPNEAILTAAQECDNSILDIASGVASTGTIRLASATVMFADCLDTVGDTREFVVLNASSSGYLTFAVGGSSTLVTAPSATSSIDAREYARVTAARVTSSSNPWLTYIIYVAQ